MGSSEPSLYEFRRRSVVVANCTTSASFLAANCQRPSCAWPMQLGDRVAALESRLTEVSDRLDSLEDLIAGLSDQLAALAIAGGTAAPTAAVDPSVVASPAVLAAVAAEERRRYYAVTSGAASAVGLWWCTWAHLCTRLPGGRLAGSGCRVRGFDSEAEGRAFFQLAAKPRRDPGTLRTA